MPAAVDILGVLPFLASEAAYVGIVRDSEEPANLIVRTYDAEGVAIADVFTVADPGIVFGTTAAAFVRGATENVLTGCALAFVLGADDVQILDLEGEALVSPATTGRQTLLAGGTWTVTIRPAADGQWWEFGVAEGVGGGVDDPLANDYAYLRKIARDGSGTTPIADDIPCPLNFDQSSPDGRAPSCAGLCPISSTQWAACYKSGELDEARWVTLVNESGSPVDVADFVGEVTVPVGLVLGLSAGSPLTRVVDAGAGGGYDGEYVEEALLALAGLTVLSTPGTVRTAGGLVVLVDEGSDATHQASRLCTYSGAHPIAASTEGPAFERDDGAGESLLWVFGL